MRSLALTCIAALLFLGTPVAAHVRADWCPSLTDRGLVMDPWRFLPGDSPERASPDLDDKAWLTLTDEEVLLRPGAAQAIGWTGLGWFRARVRVPTDLWGKRIAFIQAQSGAAQVFLNGRLVAELGRVDSAAGEELPRIADDDFPAIVSVVLDSASDQTIAVRYSNAWSQAHPWLAYSRGFKLSLADLDEGAEYLASQARGLTRLQLLFVLPLAFGLLHLLLYLFYPPARENLHYALFAGAIAALAFLPFQAAFITTSAGFLTFLAGFKIALVLTPLLGAIFFYEAFLGMCPRFLRLPAAAGVILILFCWIIPIQAYYLFALGSLPEMARVIGVSAFRRRPGARIVAAGFSVFMTASAYQMLMELRLIEQDYSYAFIHGFLALVASMSVHLAREFARTNRNLEEQLVQVKALSERSLERERLAREEDDRARRRNSERRLLEADNAAKARELAEIHRRQAILEDLALANKDLVDTQTQLVQSEKMASLGNLIAGIAHEINTPVGAINSMHDTLVRGVERLRGAIEGDYADALAGNQATGSALRVIADANRVISAGTERVTGIVRSLRSFARLDEAERKRVDLHEGIENTLTLLQHELKNRIEVVRRYGDIPEVVCFPSRMNQVFLNLLVNAAQATEGSGQIIIETSVSDGRVHIRVLDTGHGIGPESLARLFDPGFTTKSVGAGTGLGLSICQQIVQDHGGTITAANREGDGAIFTVSIPTDVDETS